MFSIIEKQLAKPLYKDFSEFSHAVLCGQSPLNQQGILEITMRCTNMSQVFACAYRCAMQILIPELRTNQWAAMCVTEEAGNHPKHIQTYLKGGEIYGSKSFVTMGDLAKQLIVLVKQGEKNDRPDLKAVLVDSEQDGVQIQSFGPLNMLSDVPHSKVDFERANATVLAGDGYQDYSKVFRTIENVCVLLASSAFIFSLSKRNDLPLSIAQQSLSLVGQLYAMSLYESPWLHVYLDKVYQDFDELILSFESHFDEFDNDFVEAWHKDKKLFKLAQSARRIRFDKAKTELAY